MSTVKSTAPLSKLRRSPRNVRRKGVNTASYKKGIIQLAMDILANGLLQNLVVEFADDIFYVAAGGRRLDALIYLLEQGLIDADYLVRILIVNSDSVVAVSFAENFQREAMHPADELDAFLEMTANGSTIDSIAHSFGISVLTVERRLKLRSAAPELLICLRNDEISIEKLVALCATDSHEVQLEVWNRCKNWYQVEASTLRREVLSQEVDANDYRVKFIGGVDAYEAAGGVCRRDLFSIDGEGVVITNIPLLQEVVSKKLEELSVSFQAQGWGWVEIWPEFDWTRYERLGQAPKKQVEPSDEIKAQLESIYSELGQVTTELNSLAESEVEDDERQDSLQERQDELTGQLDEIKASVQTYDDAVKVNAGVVISLTRDGLKLYEGMVKAEDRKALESQLDDDQRVQGGRVSETSGRKADTLSDALRRSLLGHKNLAAQFAVASNPNLAKVLLVCKFITDTRREYGVTPIDMSIESGYGTRTSCKITDTAGETKLSDFAALGDKLIETFPTDLPLLWDHVSGLPKADLDTLLAYSVAKSVSLSESKQHHLTEKMLTALSFDMADNFEVSADNYLGRVSKDLIVSALDEAGKINSEQERAALLAMKKGDLAKFAQGRLGGTRWVPSIIRSESPIKERAKAAQKTRKQAVK